MPSKILFTKEQLSLIKSLYKYMKNTREIADIVDCSNSTIRLLLIELGIYEGRRNVYKVDHNFFNVIDTEEKAYWLGFISADGNVYKKSVKIKLAIKDFEHLEKFLISLDSNYKIRYYNNNSEVVVAVTSSKMVSDLAQYGVFPNKSLILMPYYNIPVHLERHYWRGFIDGDGCVCYILNNKKTYNPILYLIGTYSVCEMFKLFCSKYSTSNAKINPKDNVFKYTISGPNAIAVMKELYVGANFYLSRKYNKSMDMINEFESRHN